jgi:hypothetical protein
LAHMESRFRVKPSSVLDGPECPALPCCWGANPGLAAGSGPKALALGLSLVLAHWSSSSLDSEINRTSDEVCIYANS